MRRTRKSRRPLADTSAYRGVVLTLALLERVGRPLVEEFFRALKLENVTTSFGIVEEMQASSGELDLKAVQARREFRFVFARRIDTTDSSAHFLRHAAILEEFPFLRERSSVTAEEVVQLVIIGWLSQWHLCEWGFEDGPEPIPDPRFRAAHRYARAWAARVMVGVTA